MKWSIRMITDSTLKAPWSAKGGCVIAISAVVKLYAAIGPGLSPVLSFDERNYQSTPLGGFRLRECTHLRRT